MADWVENFLIVKGTDEKLKEWNTLLGGGESETAKLSFAKMLPMPEEEHDWYSWCVRNWGTKWDTAPYGAVERRKGLISYAFMTPWEPPINLMMTMGEQYPDLAFELRYNYQFAGKGGIYYSGAECAAVNVVLTEKSFPNLFKDLIEDPLKNFEKTFSMFG